MLGQLGNRVQHALRAYTPNEQKAIRYAARSFRANEKFDTERVLQELATGEALVSVLDAKGTPTIVERANILPPKSSMNAADIGIIAQFINMSPLNTKYKDTVDRESAYEIISEEQEKAAKEKADAEAAAQAEKERIEKEKQAEKERKEKEKAKKEKEKEKKAKQAKKKQSAMGKAASSAATSFGRELGKSIFRGLFGTRR